MVWQGVARPELRTSGPGPAKEKDQRVLGECLGSLSLCLSSLRPNFLLCQWSAVAKISETAKMYIAVIE